MDKTKGFSLIEILLSLLLITSTSLALMRQHWQLNRDVNQITNNFRDALENDNKKEQILSDTRKKYLLSDPFLTSSLRNV